MPRLTHFALPLLGCLAAVAAAPAHAQYLYVGSNDGAGGAYDFATPGFAAITSTGTMASGNWSIISDTPVESTFSYTEVQAYNTSKVKITGGTFGKLQTSDDSIINLIGYGFAESSDYQVINSVPYYTVSGFFNDSTPFQTLYTSDAQSGSNTLEFNGMAAVPGAAPIPEASTLVSLAALLLLGAGVMAYTRRKSARTA